MLLAAGIVTVSAVIFLTAAWRTCMFTGCPDVAGLDAYVAPQASLVLDRDGNELARLFEKQRTVVALDSLPPYVPAAFVAMEDRRFYDHSGVDWVRIGGALRSNLRAGDITQGGSTITMQLARNLFPEHLPAQQRTFLRKFREMRVARMIEGEIGKDRILELYLNQIYFGEGAYGIEAAAREFFGVPAGRLSLAQAATLASMPRAPARYDPREHPDDAREGRKTVLARMVAYGAIPQAAADAAAGAEMATAAATADSARAEWFVEEVRKQLQARMGSVLYTGGFRIVTTLDPGAQKALEEELEQQAVAIEEGRYGRFRASEDGRLQYAGVVLDAATGDVLAMVGGRDFSESRFNRATQARRQPGSAFKPVVFAAALVAGHSPLESISDEPIAIETAAGETWAPRNYSRDYGAAVSMREALARSRNVATVRLAKDIGMSNVAVLAERLGIASHVPAYPSLPLGTVETTPLDLTTAYAAFATLGRRPEPRMVVRVEDRHGTIVWSAPAATSRTVLDETTAFLTTDLMRGVVDGGTGWRVRREGFYGHAAGKTGTSQEGADLWFTGFTPSTAATIWYGFDRRRPVVAGGTGGEIAAPVWGRVMRRIVPEDEAPWQVPAGLERVRVDDRGIVLAEGCLGLEPIRTAWVRTGPFTPAADCPPPVRADFMELGRTLNNGVRGIRLIRRTDRGGGMR